jgi:Trk K+ transport system NAD-binding subunit
MTPLAGILIFGASHGGIRLAERLVAASHRVTVLDPAPLPVPAPARTQVSTDFAGPANVGAARLVYVVSDQDRLNIRLALAVRRAHATVPIVMRLTQSQLGEKLARHLPHLAFINPPELAAARFVDAVYAPQPASAGGPPVAPTPGEPAAAAYWLSDPLVLRAVLVLFGIGAVATGYFHFAEKLRWIDALYFTVTTMATVGYGDFNLKDSSTFSKIFGVALMIASVANTAVIFALITDSLLKKRLVLSFGRRHVAHVGHIVVVGVGTVGLRVVEQLRARGETVVVIDSHEGGRHLPAIYSRRVPAIIGDARLERTLRDAGLPRAKAMLSVTSDDLANLEIGLNAKQLNPPMRVVLRIFDQELAQSLREQLDTQFSSSMSAIAAEALAKFADEPPHSAPTAA